ncbi:MAG: hypothetical protein ACK53X_05365 [Holosporales bacterium]
MTTKSLSSEEPFLCNLPWLQEEMKGKSSLEKRNVFIEVTDSLLRNAFLSQNKKVIVGSADYTRNVSLDYRTHKHLAVAVLCIQGNPDYISIFSDDGINITEKFSLKDGDFLYLPPFYSHGAESSINPTERTAIACYLLLQDELVK